MQRKTKKSHLMASWKKKWGKDKHLEKKIGEIAGSSNKKNQLDFLSQEYENLSEHEADKKMRLMGFSQKEREKFVKSNDELSRVFGVEKEGERPLTKKEKRKLLKKEEMHKKFNIKSSRDVAGDIKSKKNNRLEGVYNKKAGSAKEYGYANVEDEGHHKATALGADGKAASITKTGGGSIIGTSGATGLTGGNRGGIVKSGRPMGL